MTGRKLAKLLDCIMKEGNLEWTTGTLHRHGTNQYCALGMLAHGAGVPDHKLNHICPPEDMNRVIFKNDTSPSFEVLKWRLRFSLRDFPVEEYLERAKRVAERDANDRKRTS